MISIGLTNQQERWLRETLATSHSMRIEIDLMDLAGERKADLSRRLVGGSVNVDASAEITRTCQLDLLDPNRTLSFDSDSPNEAAIYMDRMIRVTYCVKVEQMNEWVRIPIFTGPVTSLSRDDNLVSIECEGKESLAKGAAMRPYTKKKGHNRVDAIKDILRDLTGENKFDFPTMNARLPRDLSLSRVSVPWTAAQKLANGLDRQLFYDGRGVCRLRRHPAKSAYTFKDGNGGTVVTEPVVSYSTDDVKNIVMVKGGSPKRDAGAGEGSNEDESKKKAPDIRATAIAQKRHPLSPQRLGRNGVPRYLLEIVEDQSIRTKKEAQSVANTRLEKNLLAAIEVSLDAMPMPLLEPGDLVRVETNEFAASFRLNQFTIPLTTGETMSVGYVKRVGAKYKKKHRRNITR